MTPSYTKNKPIDIQISQLVGLETYKALYTLWPQLYSYINDPLIPTNYYNTLVLGVVAASELSFEVAGETIKTTLSNIVNEQPIDQKNQNLVTPLIGSSYPITNLTSTTWENILWISLVVFLSFWVIWYLYAIGFWEMIFNLEDGITCYQCKSIYDYIPFF
jgi:hypothetical protein